VPLDCASGSVSGTKPRVAFQLRGKEKGRGNDVGSTCQRQQPNCGAFSLSIYCFITWPRRHLQPSTLELVASFNFNPCRQLHPSSTSFLVANFILVANFNPRRRKLQPSSPFKFQTPSLCYFLPFSLMPAMCLMLLLPDELLTKIIIHSIKDLAVFHFLNLRNKICGTFRRICNSDEVLLHMSLRDLREECKNRYVKSCFEQRFRKANHLEALCFEGMERLMRWRNPDKGLKLIGDATVEDSGAKYFLATLKYRCNPADPEAMALL
jgi:hypothetical protein